MSRFKLQYIEGGELERTWKNARRERAKQREQKIWDEFINEKDIVSVVSEGKLIQWNSYNTSVQYLLMIFM